MKILLVEPDFPIPKKSKNHKNFLPIGLLKIGGYYKKKGAKRVRLIRGNKPARFKPDKIFITSLFTYWSNQFWDSVEYYRKKYPEAEILLGGIYVSLFFKDPGFKQKCRAYRAHPHSGVLSYAERLNRPDYSLIKTNPEPVDYQIIHSSRGCVRKCKFCGTWKIEPKFIPKKSIIDEIISRKIVFYDNNLLANPYIENILSELAELKKNGEILWCESQSGFDGRKLIEKPHLGEMIRRAGFRYPRIAWDWGYNDYKNIKKQINILNNAGYKSRYLFVFMVYNWDIPFLEMEKKRLKCLEWGIQIADCRYRPLTQTFDNYMPRRKNQTCEDYYIHEDVGWTDAHVKQFRRNVRQQNICIRQELDLYSRDLENKKLLPSVSVKIKALATTNEKKRFLKREGIKYWDPRRITYPKD